MNSAVREDEIQDEYERQRQKSRRQEFTRVNGFIKLPAATTFKLSCTCGPDCLIPDHIYLAFDEKDERKKGVYPSDNDRLEILKLCQVGDLTQQKVADRFDISLTTLARILRKAEAGARA